jgi:hypothetical protein
MTKDGRDVATETGRAEGRMVESGKMRYVGAIFYETHSKNKLAFLNHLIGVNKYEVRSGCLWQLRTQVMGMEIREAES